MRQSLDAWQAMGANLYQPYLLALLAEAHALLGHIDEGFQRLQDALAVVGVTGEGLYEAELYRLHGDLLRAHASTPPRLERAEVSLQPRPGHCPSATGQSLGAARGDEPGAPVAAAGQTGRSRRTAGADLRLVHGGLGHGRPAGRQDSAGGAGRRCPPGFARLRMCATAPTSLPPDEPHLERRKPATALARVG